MPGVCLYGAQNMRPLGDKTTGRSTPFPTCLTITGFTQSHSHRSMKGLYRPWTFPFSNAPQHTTWKSDVLHFNFWNRGRCEHRERNSYFIFWAGHIKNSMHNVCTCTQIWTILYVLTKTKPNPNPITCSKISRFETKTLFVDVFKWIKWQK